MLVSTPHRILAASLLAAGLASVSLAVLAQQAPKPEVLIKTRQSAFQLLGYQSARIKASLEGSYNKDEVSKAAATIAAIANSGLGALFAPGTEQGKGWHETATKPELFKDGKHAGELAGDLSREANELARVATIGDIALVREQFGKLGRTCKACHDDFRAKD
ncbi:c-type cytochrome [Ideonella sp. YS5]|uniref:c-type cytochrome n=1 Tax=Ideonella sp. YS5 TaxID=3453714 RepID=UPI003EE838D6